MAISQAMCTSFKVELLNGIHAFSTTVARGNTNADSFKLALYTSSASLGAGTTAYTTSGEASGTGYTAAGAALTADAAHTTYKGLKAGAKSTGGKITRGGVKTFMKTKNFKLAAATALLGGASLLVGRKSYKKAAKHHNRARKVKAVTSRLKQFIEGNTSVGQ